MRTIASLFSGGGILEATLKDLGVKPIWGIEANERIAQLYKLNYPDSNLIVSRVEDIDNWTKFERPDILHISPPCIRYSQANHLGKESKEDLAMADAIVRCIETLQPQYITLENVPKFKDGSSYQKIAATLYKLKYWVEDSILNFSCYGVPQSRLRFFSIAWRDNRLCLPATKKHGGWYNAIADLIPTFEEDELTETQKKRLVDKNLNSYLQADRRKNLPSILIKRVQIRKHLATPTPEKESFCITAKICTDHRGSNRNKFINLITPESILNLNTRALARIQTVPDSYKLIGKSSVDGVAIGNGLPSLFYADLVKQLI